MVTWKEATNKERLKAIFQYSILFSGMLCTYIFPLFALVLSWGLWIQNRLNLFSLIVMNVGIFLSYMWLIKETVRK